MVMVKIVIKSVIEKGVANTVFVVKMSWFSWRYTWPFSGDKSDIMYICNGLDSKHDDDLRVTPT